MPIYTFKQLTAIFIVAALLMTPVIGVPLASGAIGGVEALQKQLKKEQ